jgi:hypothetical protein
MDGRSADNIHPSAYQRLGKRKVNSSTFIPRASAELQKYSELFDLVAETLNDVLTWQSIEVTFFF